jgi:hypothetical protein
LTPKFVQLEPALSQIFKKIIINCFETKYDNVQTCSTYLQNINKVFFEFNKIKDDVKIFIKPIQTPRITDDSSKETDKITKDKLIKLSIPQKEDLYMSQQTISKKYSKKMPLPLLI